jgi:rhodanese-related sulfurtransferase
MRNLVLLMLVACGGSNTKSTAAPTTPEGSSAATASAPVEAPAVGKREDVDVEGLAKAKEAGAVTVIDVRTMEEYGGGHVPGSVLIPAAEATPTHAALEHLPKGEPIYVIDQSGDTSSTVADALAAAGYWTINVKGGVGAWVASGRPVE